MKQSLGGMRRRVRNNGFCNECRRVVRFFSAGRSLGRRRPASVPRRLRPNLKPFVILNEVDRRTQREQRPLADYAEQGGERQTKCSQESMRDNRESDSSSLFRSPQNDNAVFALNHFRSGTHSSARPGRLRGSRFQREPAPGARSSLSEREQSLRDMLAIIVIEESILGKVTDSSSLCSSE